MSARDSQVGGDHYCRDLIQPRDVAIAWGLEYEEVLILRYLRRHRRKNGGEDLDKLIHSCELLKERLYPEGNIPTERHHKGVVSDHSFNPEVVKPKNNPEVDPSPDRVQLSPDEVCWAAKPGC